MPGAAVSHHPLVQRTPEIIVNIVWLHLMHKMEGLSTWTRRSKYWLLEEKLPASVASASSRVSPAATFTLLIRSKLVDWHINVL